ncbi:MAG: hypothetical protein JXR84_13735 [Anaerolineae bacterium]|nr:hypothetical protein [Anaerolineae bacterium]
MTEEPEQTQSEEIQPEETRPEETRTQKQVEPPMTRGWGKQITGATAGILVMAVATQIGSSLGWQPDNRTMVLLIGGAIGATLFTLDRFEQAGSYLTRRTEGLGIRIVNVLLGLLGLFVVISLVWMLTSSVGWLFGQF